MNNAAEQQNVVTEPTTTTNWSQIIARATSGHQVEASAEIKRYWDFIVEPGKAARIHVQQAQVPEGAARKLEYGYFDNLEALIATASLYAENSRLYVSLNCYEPDDAIFPLNEIREAGEAVVPEGNLAGCKHLLINPKIETTADSGVEVDEMVTMAKRVAETLSVLKWADPAIIDDGGGFNLIYRIDQGEAFAAEPLIQGLLAKLADRLGENSILIDVNAAHPAFMIPLPGTRGQKSRGAADNANRQCQIIHLPTQWKKITSKNLLAFLPNGFPKKKGKTKEDRKSVV